MLKLLELMSICSVAKCPKVESLLETGFQWLLLAGVLRRWIGVETDSM